MWSCQKCEYSNDDLLGIIQHSKKAHNESELESYVTHVLGGVKPTCACGCLAETRFYGHRKGFSRYAHGHASKVNNNWGHNQEAKEKSLKKRRDEGLWLKVPWNKGKTKENDSEFAKIAKKAYGSEKERLRKSQKMKVQWASNNITVMIGDQHPNWRGGASSLAALSRSHIYKVWTYPKLKLGNFKCSKCSVTEELTVHHDVMRFSEILKLATNALGDPGDSFEKKSELAEWVSDFHVKNDVSGVVLCIECHRKEHLTDNVN